MMLINRRKISVERIILAIVLFIGLFICYGILPEWQWQDTFLLYSSILCLSLFIIVVGQQSSLNKIRTFSFWCSLMVLGSIMAFRNQTGIDDFVYKRIFENASNLSLFQYFLISVEEIGYIFINYILYYCTNGNYNIAQAIITFGTFFLWGIAIKSQYNKNYSIPIILLLIFTHYYFLVLSAGLVRIFIAIPIVLYGLQFIWKREPKKFIFWIVVASFFHLSALSMLLFLFFLVKDGYFYRHWFVFLIIIFVIILISFILVARYLVPLLGERYAGYGKISSFGISIADFDTLPILGLALFFKRFIKNISSLEYRRYIIGIVLLSLSVIFSILSSMVSLGRLMFYANLGLIIIVSTIFGIKLKSTQILWIKLLIIVYALFYLMHTVMLNPIQNGTIFPYKSFLF